MATTFTTELGRPNKKGERPIYIRITHNRQLKREKMSFTVLPSDVNKRGEVVNNLLLLAIDKRVSQLRQKLIEIGYSAEQMPVEQLYRELTADERARDDHGFRLDYLDYGRAKVEQMVSDGREGTARSYRSALNNFQNFLQRERLDINEITKAMLMQYKEWFEENDFGTRAWELYMSCLQSLHNMAKREFNDDDAEQDAIPRSPFQQVKFKRSRAEVSKVEKRALTAEAVRLIYELPDYVDERPMMQGRENRVNIARDAFLLSFGLCGMNAVDMYHLEEIGRGGKVAYYRRKTHERSGEDSYIEMHIPEPLKAVSERLRGKRMAWVFSERYSDMTGLNHGLNKGLKMMVEWAERYYGKSAKELGLPKDLTFYAARHTWATIAANECSVGTDIVDKCLCHVTQSVAERSYIKKDYAFVDETNGKVMDVVFGK